MKLVSVIIPTHRRSETVARAVESALRQSHTELEILVIDDNGLGSAEQTRTRSVLEPYIREGSVMYIPQHENKGANAARNLGVKHCSGEYVAFLDDDDEWMPSKIEKQLSAMEAEPTIGVVYSPVIIQYDDLGLQYTTRPRLRGHIHDQLLIENYVGAMAAVLIRRAALVENELDETLPARQDYDLWIRISKKWKFELVNETLAIVHAKNTATRITANINNYINAVKMIDEKYGYEIAQLGDEARRRRQAEQAYFLASQAIKANRPELARELFLRSLRTRFSMKSAVALLSSFIGTRATVYARALQSKLAG